jgi:pimeloyl-ACP methyl ester carboxylesterase
MVQFGPASDLKSSNQLGVDEKTGHEIHLDQPDLVVNAIRAVVESAKLALG